MSRIGEADILRNKIESHSHYNWKCFSTSSNYYYNNFYSKRNELFKYKNLYDSFEPLKNDIVREFNNKKLKENELKNNKEHNLQEFNNLMEQCRNQEEINRQRNENQLTEAKNNYNNEELKFKNEVEQLNIDITNLEQEICKLKEKFNEEIDLKKKEELFKITNEYNIKLIKFKNLKELEKQRKENDFLIKKAEFEAKKKVELDDLKNKSEFVQKIIFMMKSISLN